MSRKPSEPEAELGRSGVVTKLVLPLTQMRL